MECNCTNCKYININEPEYSKFSDSYVRFTCNKNKVTNWVDVDRENTDKFVCSEYEVEKWTE